MSLKTLVDAAQIAFDAWKIAGTFTLTQHAGYNAALDANEKARAAASAVRGYANQLLSQPSPDGHSTSVYKARDYADYQIQTLDTAKALVLQDLAQHVKILFPTAKADELAKNSRDAASAVDKKIDIVKNSGRKPPPKSDGTALPDEEPSSWTRYAGFAAGGALLLWLARRAF